MINPTIPLEFMLDPSLAKEALDVMNSRKYDHKSIYNRIWFHKDKVIKARLNNHHTSGHIDPLPNLIREIDIGRKLYEAKANVPLMYGIHSESTGIPCLGVISFIVMSKLDIQHIHFISRFRDTKEDKEFIKKYNEQIDIAHNLWLVPNDSSPIHNCGVDENTGKVYLFDFESWDYIE